MVRFIVGWSIHCRSLRAIGLGVLSRVSGYDIDCCRSIAKVGAEEINENTSVVLIWIASNVGLQWVITSFANSFLSSEL